MTIKPLCLLCTTAIFLFLPKAESQDIVEAAVKFMKSLDSAQHAQALYPFDTDERYTYHYFPVDNRKGIAMDKLNQSQKQAAMDLMKTSLSEQALKKVRAIMNLEILLKAIEKRKPDDHFRDPGKYFFTIFGMPAAHSVWGWRLEGHHVYFSFSAEENKLVSGTPGFLGTNPAVIQDGPDKGMEILKDEREAGFGLLHALSTEELRKAILDSVAPADIITGTARKAMIGNPSGLRFTEMTSGQQTMLLDIISLYVHRFTKLFAEDMLKQIQGAGIENLWFAWSGYQQPGIGRPHYYRIQGPTIVIEYDNTQNNANHVHTVVRDLQHDFGGDILLEHYKASH
jgi:hypothetical protein